MPTGFFQKPRQKVTESPPAKAAPNGGGRERYTTEEYWNRLAVPTTTPILPGVHIKGMWTAFSERSQGQLVQQSFRNSDGNFVHTLHAVINPVKQ